MQIFLNGNSKLIVVKGTLNTIIDLFNNVKPEEPRKTFATPQQ